jgi:hypothetical protein
MKYLRRTTVSLVFLVILAISVPLVVAQGTAEANWPFRMTIDESFQIGDLVFPPGSYHFQLSPGTVSRQVLMIYSLDRRSWEGIVLGVNAQRYRNSMASGFTFVKNGEEQPKQLEYWFYSNWGRGVKFISSQNPQIVVAGSHKDKTPIAMIDGKH